MQALKPKLFIKANEKTEKYECAICNYITQKPYICKGKCQKMFCFQCLNCVKRNNNQCPFKCSKPFDLIQCKQVQLQFTCPFQPQKCENMITSLSQFYAHGGICKFVPQNWKEKEENFKRYRCQKGHDLFFLDQEDLRKLYGWRFYDMPTNSTCTSCKQKGLCRSLCPKCSQKDRHVLYCTSCRKPPCTKLTCLYSHNLQKQLNRSSGLICDFCGTAAYLLGPYAFRDLKCNFDICQVCYINLPETHELVPFKMSKNSISHLLKNQQHQSSDEEVESPMQRIFRRMMVGYQGGSSVAERQPQSQQEIGQQQAVQVQQVQESEQQNQFEPYPQLVPLHQGNVSSSFSSDEQLPQQQQGDNV